MGRNKGSKGSHFWSTSCEQLHKPEANVATVESWEVSHRLARESNIRPERKMKRWKHEPFCQNVGNKISKPWLTHGKSLTFGECTCNNCGHFWLHVTWLRAISPVFRSKAASFPATQPRTTFECLAWKLHNSTLDRLLDPLFSCVFPTCDRFGKVTRDHSSPRN